MDNHPSKVAVIENHLRFVEKLVGIQSGNSHENSMRADFETDPKVVATYVVECPEAFYSGVILSQTLLDVLVFPYVKISHCINKEARIPASSLSRKRAAIRKQIDATYTLWAFAMAELGVFAETEAKKQVPSLLLKERLAELLEALLERDILEVIKKDMLIQSFSVTK